MKAIPMLLAVLFDNSVWSIGQVKLWLGDSCNELFALFFCFLGQQVVLLDNAFFVMFLFSEF